MKGRIPGGLAEKRGKKPSDFSSAALKQGIKVEMEHTNDPKIAKEIAMDHLTEDSKYYSKLKKIEKSTMTKSEVEILIKVKKQTDVEVTPNESDVTPGEVLHGDYSQEQWRKVAQNFADVASRTEGKQGSLWQAMSAMTKDFATGKGKDSALHSFRTVMALAGHREYDSEVGAEAAYRRVLRSMPEIFEAKKSHGTTMTDREIEILEKADKPYGHEAYTRRDPRTGKMVQVQARGAKPTKERKFSGYSKTQWHTAATGFATRAAQSSGERGILSEALGIMAKKFSQGGSKAEAKKEFRAVISMRSPSEGFRATYDTTTGAENAYKMLAKYMGLTFGAKKSQETTMTEREIEILEKAGTYKETPPDTAQKQGRTWRAQGMNTKVRAATPPAVQEQKTGRTWRTQGTKTKVRSTGATRPASIRRSDTTMTDREIDTQKSYWADDMYDNASTVEDLVKSDLL